VKQNNGKSKREMRVRRNKGKEKVENRRKNREGGRGSKGGEKEGDRRGETEEKRNYWIQCVAPSRYDPPQGPVLRAIAKGIYEQRDRTQKINKEAKT
jgi:hypothetical protein